MKSVQNALNRRKKGEKGFTLVELLVVVIIIGILAAVAVPIYLNQRKSAWRSSVQSDVKNASLVLETISTDKNGKLSGITIPDKCDAPSCDIEGEKVTVSADNHLTFVVKDDNTYTITGTNDNLKDESVVYDSSTGSMSTTK
ncbi:type IV pilin protein [Bifidobacterium thermophilum]|uniref:Prepilin-type N-terminal cleavage/methylation domain-containing protein n=1 Tax=Bifidobacterium thermophilum RBL67 TaxID=1254439 RepID=M4RE53_9BIFI|nr:prepilin-type N-terminal cleavage/methylation domain-containing protein [Bifidobacterium thermophilum]AGH40434.1 prepilin-type N-terminal cleavage/methylation domain-containing protein [Bifidobacterium thermophilum RBL67]MDW8485888.1 prepilin-type N-terminal cleavage/methylation domain-containing protein [Bifidobacterium thermophilum]